MPVRTRTTQLTTTEAAVMGLLSHGPRSGYDLKKAVEWFMKRLLGASDARKDGLALGY